MNNLQVFKNEQFGEVRTIEENGKILFCGNDCAKALGYERPKDAIYSHCKGAVKRSTLTAGGKQEMSFIPEGDLYRLIAHSKLPSAEKFESWVFDEVLPSIRKHGAYIAPGTEHRQQVSFKEQVECVGVVANILRVNDASKIMMLNQLYKSYNLPAAFLPKYEYNGSRELKSATDLLKRFGLEMSARSFNVLLREQGYLEERTRKSTSSPSGVKKYNALTEKGLKYGENAVSPQCQREVQPMYYADSFEELFGLVVNSEVA